MNKQENTLLQLMETLSEKSEDSRLSEEFMAQNGAEAAELASRLSITPTQAVLFPICLRKGPRNVDFDDIARKYSISTILYGNEMHSMDVLHAFCSAEKIDNQERRRIGF